VNRPVVVLEESRQAEDDGRAGDDDDVAVGALHGAESLSVKRSTDSDVAVDGQQHRQPRVDHTQHVRARKQPVVEKYVDVLVVDVDQYRDVTKRAQQEDDEQDERVGDSERLRRPATQPVFLCFVKQAARRGSV